MPWFHFWGIKMIVFFKKNGPSPTSFSLFSSFQNTVDSKQMFNINKFLPMTGFKPRTHGIGSDRSTNWATQPLSDCYNFTLLLLLLNLPPSVICQFHELSYFDLFFIILMLWIFFNTDFLSYDRSISNSRN